MIRSTRRPVRRLTALTALTAGLALGGTIALQGGTAQAVPQPGQVPHVNFNSPAQRGSIYLDVKQPSKVGDASVYETRLTLCNRGTEPQPVGPDTFSHTSTNYKTSMYSPHDGLVYKGLTNQLLAAGKCATGSLVNSGAAPTMLSFHDLRTGGRIDILPATEWPGIPKVSGPRSAGTSNYYGDSTGDQRADVVALSDNKLVNYGTGSGPSLSNRGPIATMLPFNATLNWVGKTHDVDENGASDLLLRSTNGQMFLKRMMGQGRGSFATVVGNGFNSLSVLTVLPDSNGNGSNELLGRDANGTLRSYEITAPRLASRKDIGKNWQNVTHLLSVGDFSGDGKPDLLAIDKAGDLYRYSVGSNGALTGKTKVGHGWGATSKVFSPGDMNGDGRRDLVSVRKDGTMWFYANVASGKWSAGKQIGRGWNSVTSMA